MTIKAVKLSLSLAFMLGLAACGGGGGDDASSNNSVAVSDSVVVADLKASNIDFVPENRPAGTWRWTGTPGQAILVVVPAATNTTEQDYAAKVANAIALINSKLSGLVVLQGVSTAPAAGNFIQVSYGTSYVPPGSTNYSGYCANVSTGVGLGNVIQPDSQNGIATAPVYVNLGNGHCDVTQDIVTHEFGHALGLSSHFEGFGTGDSISSAFWDVLATLYGNGQSTTADKLVVARAKN